MRNRPASMVRAVPTAPIVALVVAAGLAAGVATPAAGQPAAAKAPDWTGLDRLLEAGDYDRASRVADDILALPEPKRSDADFLSRKLGSFRALSKRGLAELRLGRFDAAEETLGKASRVFKNQDVQKLLSLDERSRNQSAQAKLVPIQLAWIELLSLRAAVIIDRIRAANLARSALPAAAGADRDGGEPHAVDRETVDRWIRDLQMLRSISAVERKSLADRFDQGGSAYTSSPLARSLVGRFRSAMLAGSAALEIGSLPFPIPGPPSASMPAADETPAPGSPPVDGRQQWLAEAITRLEEASQSLDEAVVAASPTGAAGLRPAAKIEAALLKAELLANRAAARRRTGDMPGAREDAEAAIALRLEAGKLRKDVRPESHPDLAWPLVLAAEIAVEEIGRHVAAGEGEQARARAQEASTLLARAASLPIPDDHPLRGALAGLSTRLESHQGDLERSLPRSEAADAASRRVRRAIDAMAPAGFGP